MVADNNNQERFDPGGIRKMLGLLDSLRETPAGQLIFRQFEAMLEAQATEHLESELAYAGFVNVMLDAWCSHLQPGSPDFVQLRLLQARLQPPLTATELACLGEFILQAGNNITAARADPALLDSALHPLLAAFGIGDVAVAPTAAFSGAVESQAAAAPPDQEALDAVTVPAAGEDTAGSEPAIGADQPAAEVAAELEAESPVPEIADEAEIPAGQDLHEINRSELELRREEIAKLQATLGEQVMETIGKNEEFSVLLDRVLGDLRKAEDQAGIENMRWTLIRGIEKMMNGQQDLADKLDSTHHYLRLYESDSRQLTDELTRVRLLSLTDELTGLPNRRAFLRRLEDEVARVQRYGYPLSFVLIDLDHFKSVNDEFGHAAGDEVLRVYSNNVLSIFRHHDMVARYGGEEFAVLLPNTDSDGTIRALNKVRRRAKETRWQTNGTAHDVPTFSAGVSLYKPGEPVAAFIERADKALYRAKRLGRNRVELDMTYLKEIPADGTDAPRRRSTDQQ